MLHLKFSSVSYKHILLSPSDYILQLSPVGVFWFCHFNICLDLPIHLSRFFLAPAHTSSLFLVGSFSFFLNNLSIILERINGQHSHYVLVGILKKFLLLSFLSDSKDNQFFLLSIQIEFCSYNALNLYKVNSAL